MLITDDGYIEVDVTPDMVERAKAKANAMGELRNSIRRGKGNLVGFLGEEIVMAAWGGATSANTFHHDITFEEVTFEVKSKDRTVVPKPTYEASVANYNATQKADFYVFVSVLRQGTDYVKGHIVGIYDKASYVKDATYLEAGDVDPSNGWVVSANCYNLPYWRLANFLSWKQKAA